MTSVAAPACPNDSLLRLPSDMKDTNLLVDFKEVPNAKNDIHIIEIGKFAVDEHNKQECDNLVFVCVLTAKTKILMDGKDYYLIIEAKKDGTSHTYEARVWEKETYKKLLLFKKIDF